MTRQDHREQNILTLIKKTLDKEDCFGLSDHEFMQLKKWLYNARLNGSSSKFPDFIFDNGFIEHFAITSSFESKKGAKQQRESKSLQRNSEINFHHKLGNSGQNELVTNHSSRPFEQHTHMNLVNSIQKNWRKHIKSYEKSNNSLRYRIFVLEYLDINIETGISEKNKPNQPSKHYDSYRISADKHLLKWIYEFKEKIDYLILINPNSLPISLEVIKINKIPDLLEREIKVWYLPSNGIQTHHFRGNKTMRKDM